MAISSRNTLLAALAFIAFQAQAVNVTVAYQTSAEPAKVAQADNTFAKESGATVDWRKFDSGASIVRALASGDVQIGNLGSSPLAVAASQQVPIEVFLLASKLGNSEALVVKKTISKPEDLIGKRIAVPFISTTHYSLLSALSSYVTAQDLHGDASGMKQLVAATVRTADGEQTLTYYEGTDGYYLTVSGDASLYTVDAATVQTLCTAKDRYKAAS